MKKKFSVILAALILIISVSVITLSVSAGTTPTISLEQKTAGAGENVSVVVSIENNPGIWGADIKISYDKTAMTLTSVDNGDFFQASEWTKGNLSADVYILSYEASGFDNITTASGTLATLNFKIKDTAETGTYNVTASYNAGDIINATLDDIDFQITNGSIKVETAVDEEAIKEDVSDNFLYMGASINPTKSGLRVRAKVTSALLGKTLATDSYKPLRFGIVVSKTSASELTVSRGNVITAYNDKDHGKDNYKTESDGSVSFAAVIINIPKSAYETNLYYRPFFEYEDANGNVKVIYIDSAVDSKNGIIELTSLSYYDTTTNSICRNLSNVCQALYDGYLSGNNDYFVSDTNATMFIADVLNLGKDADDIEIKIGNIN